MGRRYRITINKERCTLCRFCEVQCSIAVSGEFNPDISIIKEIKPKDSPNEITCTPPTACITNPQCLNACENRALKYEAL